jgi:hypothetical protein
MQVSPKFLALNSSGSFGLSLKHYYPDITQEAKRITPDLEIDGK